jgi:pimeloyl-ACP methyl ester carboxylesterase
MPTLATSGGAQVEYLVDDAAEPDAPLLVFHHGTPAAGPLDPALLVPARVHGFRLVELVRPGYGASTRQAGRRVADVAPWVSALADLLGHERFATIGWSGGGPHALATAALLPERCVGALSLAGVAPFGMDGLDWLEGMGQDNIDEFGAALAGDDALTAYLEGQAGVLAEVRGEAVIDAMASLLPAVDRGFLTGEAAETMAAALRFSLAGGVDGWFDDDRAFCAPWGFDLARVRVPVLVWQGSDDLMVPFAHGRWLAENVPSARVRLSEGDGHLSMVARVGEGIAELRALLR